MKIPRIAFGVFMWLLFASWADCQTIALTFDDGPKPEVLEELIPLLVIYKVPATFFVLGAVAKDHPEYIKKEKELGFEIENHSWGHENFKKLFAKKGTSAVQENISKTSDTIFNLTGRRPIFFRPPFWVITPEIEKIVKGKGYTVMKLEHPDISSNDWEDVEKQREVNVLIGRVKKLIHGKKTHIMVFHELHLTVGALSVLVPYFQEQGYKFTRLDEVYPIKTLP